MSVTTSSTLDLFNSKDRLVDTTSFIRPLPIPSSYKVARMGRTVPLRSTLFDLLPFGEGQSSTSALKIPLLASYIFKDINDLVLRCSD